MSHRAVSTTVPFEHDCYPVGLYLRITPGRASRAGGRVVARLQLAQQVEHPSLNRDASAVVGSSAMTSRGRQARAMAIMTRCRMPPDS
jgi:hypothetical protein